MEDKEMPTLKAAGEVCTGKLRIPSEKEQAILAAMRASKERVRALKRRLAALSSSRAPEAREERARIEQELTQRREEWQRLEAQRDEATRERMVLLGHEEAT